MMFYQKHITVIKKTSNCNPKTYIGKNNTNPHPSYFPKHAHYHLQTSLMNLTNDFYHIGLCSHILSEQ